MTKSAKGIPANVLQMLEAADERQGFPKGTMAAVMQQEVGGQLGKFLSDPTAYHYGLNADGKRVAGHTGKVSTAFGPFGILESTGAQPGYGVAPLKDKSLQEQVRFAADYLAARSKRAGGLEKGLAGYGEGDKYSAQVMARAGGAPAKATPGQDSVPASAQEAPVMTASAPAPISQREIVGEPQPAVVQRVQVPANDPWGEYLTAADRKPITPSALQYGPAQEQPGMQVNIPQFMAMGVPQGRVDFRSLAGFGRMGGRA